MKPRTRPARMHVLEREPFVPMPLDESFEFFADAHNLGRITPSWLGFRVVTAGAIDVHAGTTLPLALALR